MVTCPGCKGKGHGEGFMCGPGVHKYGPIQCSTCNGSGSITERQAALIEQAKPIAADRMARNMTIREEAKRLGVGYAEWSRIEHGRAPETEAGKRALETRLAELAAS